MNVNARKFRFVFSWFFIAILFNICLEYVRYHSIYGWIRKTVLHLYRRDIKCLMLSSSTNSIRNSWDFFFFAETALGKNHYCISWRDMSFEFVPKFRKRSFVWRIPWQISFAFLESLLLFTVDCIEYLKREPILCCTNPTPTKYILNYSL